MEHWVYTFNLFNHSMSVNMDTVITMWLAMGLLLVVAFMATRKVSIVPTKLQVAFENILGFFWGMSDSLMGREGRKHIPLIVSLFLFIITANLMGQVPMRVLELKQGELASPTNDINLTAAMAIIVLIYYIAAGLKKKNFKFLLKDFSPISIFICLIDLLEMFTRPLTLALRLFGNVLAGEILISAMLGICAYVLPLPFMFFEVLVACVQALVFAMLTMVYVSTAIQDE
ncbi:MAG: F0F1 ATP synthase subunit A [Clostridiaceae bacterium]|jgi:F-type H+-transporting ATPase subunit a|nr:F0F1 ATP synthase subunit A [Clostridiaceae bacterium]